MNGRSIRRALVLAVLAISAGLVAALPASLHGAGMLAVVALLVLDLVLLRATGGLAFARARSLDERQAALRDLAYRRGFRLLGLGLVAWIVIAYVTTWSRFAVHPVVISELDTGVGGRVLVAALELLAMMPTLVIAWVEPNRAEDGPAASPGRGSLPVAALTVVAIVLAWTAAVARGPVQTVPGSRNFSVVAQVPDGTCSHFAGGRMVGAPLGASLGMRAEVCWNGREAFLSPDVRLTLCGADNADDFALVSDTRCAASTDADGTLRYTVRGRVSPLPWGIAARDLAMRLVVTRDGRVLEHP